MSVIMMVGKPIICDYCKKLIDTEKECFEEHERKYYHADCINKF